jgi:MFS family permease
VPLLQRYFNLPLQQAAVATGLIVGVTGLIGLTLGGWITDKVHHRWARGRMLFGAISMLIAAAATAYALIAGQIEVSMFVGIFAIGWLFSYNFFTTTYTAMQDVIEPRLRGTAMALFFAALYLLGGGMGPLAVGLLSDYFSNAAQLAAGAEQMNEVFKAQGLHDAMLLIPLGLLVAMLALFCASRTFVADARKMKDGLRASASELVSR